MDKDTALDLALEALKQIYTAMPFPAGSKAITAIKQARALDKKAENARELGLDYEPVGQNICIECANADSWGLPDKPACRSCVSNSEWKPLNVSSKNPINPPAQPAPVQEPVAHCEAGPEHCQQCHLEDRSLALAAAVRYVKNNTPKLVSDEICMALASITAAQRQWVGLTDEEIAKLDCYDHLKFARAIEAKLKEKNA